eukprot:jgi/Ulvmu1/12831/UM098_0013.1
MGRSFCVPRKRDAPDTAPPQGALRQENACPNKTIADVKTERSSVVDCVFGGPTKQTDGAFGDKAFAALYTQRSNKRRNNKSWTDGFVLLRPVDSRFQIRIFSAEGKEIFKGPQKEDLDVDDVLQAGNWDIEIGEAISPDSILSGSCYVNAAPSHQNVATVTAIARTKVQAATKTARVAAPLQQAPAQEGALVLQEGSDAGGTSRVVVDAFLARKLREHQKEGVQFLYNALSGRIGLSSVSGGDAGSNRDEQGRYSGCILADEMGLGKTVQVLAASWAMMSGGGPSGRPLVRKMLVVAPSSVIRNWGQEIKKWLGMERAAYLVLMPGKEAAAQVTAFRSGVKWRMLIASYENIRKHCAMLRGAVDLLICDEGHRLKSKTLNSTMKALLDLKCRRTAILTGTPVQNNLSEFYAMMSFVNPGLLGPPAVFQRVFVGPIEASHDAYATREQADVGTARAAELQRRIGPFMLRRTAAINERYLPTCATVVVFCRPTEAQLRAYRTQLYGDSHGHCRGDPLALRRLAGASGMDSAQALSVISQLRQICNHAAFAPADKAAGDDAGATQLDELSVEAGACKLQALRCVIEVAMRQGERVVCVSTSTRMLDAAQLLCDRAGATCARIDGSTAPADRQNRVDAFNSPNGQYKVFLLSTRAGGAGLNLIRGSRLVLLDSDWNPAMDQQAMARIWRDGQKKPCYIYRLLVTGLIDEKIFQRQLYKGGLSGVVGDGGSAPAAAGGKSSKQKGGGGFSKDELRKLFSMNEETDCDTRDVLSAASGGGQVWRDCRGSLADPVLDAVVEGGCVSFAWLEGARGDGAEAVMAAAGRTLDTPCEKAAWAVGGSGASDAESDGEDHSEGGGGSGGGEEEREMGAGLPGRDEWGGASPGGDSAGTQDFAEALALVDSSDSDDAAPEHARDLMLDSD